MLPLVLTACVGQRPEAPRATAVTPPPGWRAALPPTTELDRAWWRTFGDPVLAELVERAQARNTDIGEAAARVDVSRALARLARAERAPLVNLSGTAEYRRLDLDGLVSDTGSGVALIDASWDVDLFGRLRFASAAARAQLLASAATRDAIVLSVASTTASSYITLRGLDAQLQIVRDTLVLQADTLRLATRRYERGYTSRLEYLQAKGQYETTQSLIPDLERGIAQQENALSVLIGDNPRAIARGQALAALRGPGVPAGLPSDLLRRRPDIYAAEETLVAADRTLDSSRAAMLPQLELTGMAMATFATTGISPISLFTVGGNFLGPLFDGGRRRARADADAARRDGAAWSYRGAVLSAFREVEDNLVAVRRYGEQQVILTRRVGTGIDNLRVSRERYLAGYAPFLDQLDAQRVLLSAQQSLVQTQTDRLNGYVSLYAALGGGWQAPPTTEPASR